MSIEKYLVLTITSLATFSLTIGNPAAATPVLESRLSDRETGAAVTQARKDYDGPDVGDILASSDGEEYTVEKDENGLFARAFDGTTWSIVKFDRGGTVYLQNTDGVDIKTEDVDGDG